MIKRLLLSVFATLLCQLAIAQSISSNSPLCTDNSSNLELKASGGSSYAWSGPNGFTSNQQNPIINRVNSSNAGTYSCIIDGKSVLNTLVKIGKSTTLIDAYYYPSGARMVLYSYWYNSNSSGLSNYSWTGVNNFKAIGSQAFINSYDKTFQGIYTVTANDEFGCALSKSIQVNISDCSYQPTIIARSKSGNSVSWSGTGTYSLNACSSSPTTLLADTAYWGAGLKFQWYKDTKAISNATSLQYQPSEGGNYYFQINKGNCSYTSPQINVRLGTLTPFIELDYVNGKYLSEKEICAKGGNTILNSYIIDNYLVDGSISHQWYKDGVAVPTTSTYSSQLVATEAGKYQVKMKAGQCETMSDAVTVKAVENPKPYFYFNVAGNELLKQSTLKLCNEYASWVQLEVRASGNGNKKIYKDGVPISTNTSSQFNYTISQQSATYILETTQGQCKSSDTLKLEYGKTTDILATKSDWYSCTNPINFYYYINTNLTPYNGIKWYKDDALFSTFGSLNPNSSATYQAKYENTSTGCKGESEKIKVVVPSTPVNTYLKIVFPYTKKITICKNNKDVKTIRLNNYFFGGVWKRNGNVHDSGSNYYQTSISQAGKYWYEYYTGQCTIYSDTLEVVEEELPKITLTQTCLKDNTIKLNINAIAGVKYNWFQNGNAIVGKDTTITVSQSGRYIAESYRNGCSASSNEINVGVSISEVTNICNGDSLKLKAVSDASITYNWTGPNNFKSSLQNPFVAKTTKNSQGIYKLSATDKGGCNFVAQTQAIVNDLPAFTLPKTITACAGSEFLFNQFIPKPLTDSTESVSYFNTIAPNKNNYYGNFYLPTITATDAGTYNVTVYGNQGGCIVKTSTELIVDASAACRSITLLNPNPNSARSVCAEQTVEIPFTTIGAFKTGTVFRAYYEESYYATDGLKIRKTILGTSQKSPIKISGLKSSYNYNVNVESDDGIASIRSQYLFTNSNNSNYITDANGYNRSAECTSLPLSLGSNYTYLNPQWFLNNDTLKKETNRNVIALKTGTYTFKGIDANGCNVAFSKDVVIGKLDKPQISNVVNDLSCFNESVFLNANQYYNNVKYTWRRDGILQSDNNNYIQATIAGKYILEVSKETCKINSDTIIIKQSLDKNTNLTAYTYTGRDSNNETQTFIYINGLGSATYKFQLFKDNQLFAEGRDGGIVIKDAGKYFFKVVKGDCEAISDVVDFKGVNTILSSQRNLYFNGTYDYTSNTVQLCDTSLVQTLYGYPDLTQTNVVKRVITAYRNDKLLPTFKDGVNVYPSIRFNANDANFYLYFKGAGTYYITEEVTLKDSTKLKLKYGEMKVVVSSIINLGIQTPQNSFSCADSVLLYGNNYTNNQRPISFNWKKDGVVVKKIANPNDVNYLIVKQSGTYVLEANYKGGCIGISTPNKVEIGKAGIGLDTTSRLLCDGTTVMLNSYYFQGLLNDTNKVISQVSYQWLKDGKDYTPLKGVLPQDVFRNISLSTKEAGVYAIKVQQGKCQGTSPNVTVKLNKVPSTINYADSVLFCQTQSVNLKTTEDATLTYLWERDGGFIKDASKATLEVKEAGIYRSLNRKASCWAYTPKVRAKVLANILPTATLTGDKEINYADTAKVSIAFTSHAPWAFKLSDGKEYTATKSPFEVSLRPQFSTNYTLTEVKNVCGIGTISGTANIKVLILSSEQEEGVNLNVFPVPSKEDVSIQLVLDKPEAMEWTLNNTLGNVLTSESQANKSTKHESTVSLKSLPEGVYFLRIQVGERSLIRKIVKTN